MQLQVTQFASINNDIKQWRVVSVWLMVKCKASNIASTSPLIDSMVVLRFGGKKQTIFQRWPDVCVRNKTMQSRNLRPIEFNPVRMFLSS